MQLLKDKIALITGATAGIGQAMARRFVEAGAKVAFFGTNQERGQAVLQELQQLANDPAAALFIAVNVANCAEVEQAVQQVLNHFGRVDVLVNNAGITRDNLFMRMTEAEWDEVLDVNLKSAFNTCKALVRSMIKARSGKIINVSSVVGLTGNAGQVNYSASKSGLLGFTKSLAKELASRNICVNCIAPGFIKTRMTDELPEKIKESILASIPMGRMGDGTEIADAALFLASDLSRYVTGQVLAVDGGMVM